MAEVCGGGPWGLWAAMREMIPLEPCPVYALTMSWDAPGIGYQHIATDPAAFARRIPEVRFKADIE